MKRASDRTMVLKDGRPLGYAEYGDPMGLPIILFHVGVSVGAEDNLAHLALARYMAEHIPGCVIKVIPSAGHTGTFSCVDEVMSTLISR
jgi:hypothetical protein